MIAVHLRPSHPAARDGYDWIGEAVTEEE
jgi:hypothetical protein